MQGIVLKDWVTASEIKIVLNRMNSFGDEVFRDPKVLRSYYYAISDFAVGGRYVYFHIYIGSPHLHMERSSFTSISIRFDRRNACLNLRS